MGSSTTQASELLRQSHKKLLCGKRVPYHTNYLALATKEGRNANGHFANRWKRHISLAARRAIIYQAHYALRKHLRDGNPDYDELSDDESFDDREIRMNDI